MKNLKKQLLTALLYFSFIISLLFQNKPYFSITVPSTMPLDIRSNIDEHC